MQDRKTQRGISDAVAIVYATIALGEDRKGLLIPNQKFENCEAFVIHQKWKLLGESTVYQLVYETTSLRMAEHGAARYVAIFETYRQFLGTEYDPGLTVNFIAGMLDHLRVKLARKKTKDICRSRGDVLDLPQDGACPT